MKKFLLALAMILGMTVGSAEALQKAIVFYDIQRVWADPDYVHMGISACAVDTTGTLTPYCFGSGDIQLPIAAPGTWKDIIVGRVIEDANDPEIGFSLTAADVYIIPFEAGDYKTTIGTAAWTKDAIKTNLGASFVNVYIGAGGELQGVDFTMYKQYRFMVAVNKIGTGTQTAALVDALDSNNYISLDDTGSAGEHGLDSGWTDLPSWAVGEKWLKPQAKTSNPGDDPVYRGFKLYLR